MTREEQIHKVASTYLTGNSDLTASFIEAFEDGAKWADNHPKYQWISVEEDLPCNHQELTHSNYTDRVLISASNGFAEVAFMCIIEDTWEWETPIKVSHWMPIPKLLKE